MNLSLFTPEIALAVTALAVIILDIFLRRKTWLAVISLVGLAVSAVLAAGLWGEAPRSAFYGMLEIDRYALFFKFLFLGISALVIVASLDYIRRLPNSGGEYYALLLITTLGLQLMAGASELISIFISLEMVNISLYSLVGILRDSRSTEAALKYMLLSAAAGALLLLGMAILYGFTGRTQLAEISAALQGMSRADWLNAPALVMGLALILGGFGFKIAMVPFQMWVPDVYTGAPLPITAFLSVAGKSAGFAVILRVLTTLLPGSDLQWGLVLAVLAALTMTIGNITALPQKNLKRLLGYSSIAQAGYVMMGLAVAGLSPTGGAEGQSSLLFFLLCYTLANLGIFIAIIVLVNNIDNDQISACGGLGRRSPGLAMVITLSLISLIGLPPAAGFMAKFYLFSAAVNHHLLWLVLIAVLNSALSAFYYLRLVRVMWMERPVDRRPIHTPVPMIAVLWLCCLGMLFCGLVPGLGMRLAEMAALIRF